MLVSKRIISGAAAVLLMAPSAGAQLPQALQSRFAVDSAFLDRVRVQGIGSNARLMQDSVRLRLPALDSTFNLLIASGNADAAARFAVLMNSHWTRFGDYSRSLSQFRRAFALTGPPTRARAVALNSAAFLAFRQNDQNAARSMYEEALRGGEQFRDSAAIATAHAGLGRVAARNGNYAETQREAEAAIIIRDAMGDPRGKVNPYHMLAFAHRLQKNYEAAARIYEYTIALHGLNGNPGGVASEMFNLGFTRLHQDDIVTAERLLRESLTAMRTLNHPDQLYVLGAFAALATIQKQPRRAATLWGAMEAALERAKLTLDPDDQIEIDTYVPKARAQMKAADFDAARVEGRNVSLQDAVALALKRE